MLMGGVSASAPFGTADNVVSTGRNRGNMYGSKVSPFGTDDNEYNKNMPKNDHRQNGSSMNITSARSYKNEKNDEVKKIDNVI